MKHATQIAARPRLSWFAALLALVLPVLPSAVGAQTLCAGDEVDYFSCPVNGGKILSICSNLAETDIGGPDSWVQYRFGTPNKVELAFPREKAASMSRFEGHVFAPRGDLMETTELRFMNGRTYYTVALHRSHAVHDEGRARYDGGVGVGQPRAKPVSISCRKVDGERYFRRFTDLNYELIRHARQSGNQQDMLRDFRLQNAGRGR